MNKSVEFLVDDNCEMLVVKIDGKDWLSGNFWDFDFVRDVPNLLDKLGIENYQNEFEWDDGDEED